MVFWLALTSALMYSLMYNYLKADHLWVARDNMKEPLCLILTGHIFYGRGPATGGLRNSPFRQPWLYITFD